MEPTIKEMIERLIDEKRKIDNELVTIDTRFRKIRGDFGTEIGRAKEKSNNVGAAIAILVEQYSQNPNGSRLSPSAYKRIIEWLDKPPSF